MNTAPIKGYESLAGRTAVITGAASGMGAATGQLLAAAGARVALLAGRADRLDTLAKEITADGGQALAGRDLQLSSGAAYGGRCG